MRPTRSFLIVATILCVAIGTLPQTAPHKAPLFEFHSNYWLNLHHTLYREAVRLKQNAPIKPLATDKLSEPEKVAWDKAVQFYAATYSGKRLLLDDDLVKLNEALANSPDDGSKPPLVDGTLLKELKSVDGIYRKYWWPEHDAANKAWISAIGPRSESEGPPIAIDIARVLQEPFPSNPHRVDVSFFVAEVGGAYTTENPGHTMLSSARIQPDDAGFEILFHEVAHVMTGKLERSLNDECKNQKKDCPRLWHSVQFYTVGEILRQRLAANGVTYTTYAEKNGIWQRGEAQHDFKPTAANWQPYLDGKTTMEMAVVALVKDW